MVKSNTKSSINNLFSRLKFVEVLEVVEVKKILFVSYGGGHVNLLLPVFNQLSKKENYSCEYLALTTAGSALKSQGVPYLGFKDLLEESDIEAIAYGRDAADVAIFTQFGNPVELLNMKVNVERMSRPNY